MSKQEVERTDSGTRLFAWVSPAFTSNSPVDHTFVTSYDSRLVTHADISAVKEHQAHFWFCWGGFRRKGESEKFPHGLVTSGAGRLQLARCLCESNIPSKEDTAAQGTIFQYGYDGVCHQLGNQILWATEGANRPLTFAGARGYWASTAMWSTYGRDEDEWEAKRRSCAPEWGAAEKGEDAMFGDEFFRHAADV